jgi:hypothetical protein
MQRLPKLNRCIALVLSPTIELAGKQTLEERDPVK